MPRNDNFNRYQFWYSLSSLSLAALYVICGTALFLCGITGNVAWKAEFLSIRSNLSNAGSGLIIVIVGFFIVYVTRQR